MFVPILWYLIYFVLGEIDGVFFHNVQIYNFVKAASRVIILYDYSDDCTQMVQGGLQ